MVRLNRRALRWGLFAVLMLVALALVMARVRHSALEKFSAESYQSVQVRHHLYERLYEERKDNKLRFVTALDKTIAGTPNLTTIGYLDEEGEVLFRRGKVLTFSAAMISHAQRQEVGIRYQKGILEVSLPANGFVVVYVLDALEVEAHLTQIFLWSLVGILVLSLLGYFFLTGARLDWMERRFLGLRGKLVGAFLLVSLVTVSIFSYTIVDLQYEEEGGAIRETSRDYARLSTYPLMKNFLLNFHFDYQDRFLPELNQLQQSQRNLVGVRIIDFEERRMVFDSRSADFSPEEHARRGQRWELGSSQLSELRQAGFLQRQLTHRGEDRFQVLTLHAPGRDGRVLNILEFEFAYRSLVTTLNKLKRQILIDFLPSFVIGFLVAILLARILIAPLRNLAHAMRKVAQGDYDVALEHKRLDEVGQLVRAFNQMTQELQKREKLRKYLSESTYQKVVGEERGQFGQKVRATVLFSDIRDFVKMCESWSAEEVTQLLNDYFSAMVEVVHRNGGEVDKFIGDALLAVFYEKDLNASTSLQATLCALEMRERLKAFNASQTSMGRPTLRTGIGINEGELISGPIGSRDRMDFTVIGDPVNVAARIEKLSKLGRHTSIVFSQSVCDRIDGLVDFEEIPAEKIKGKAEETKVYELVRLRELGFALEGLESTEVQVVLKNLELLSRSQNPEALSGVEGVFRGSKDELVRLKAVLALGKLAHLNPNQVLETVLLGLSNDKSVKVQSALLSTLGRLNPGPQVQAVLPFLESEDERVVANAVESLGLSGQTEHHGKLVEKLGSPSARVKANAAIALFTLGKVEVIGWLGPMLLDSSAKTRSSAAFALGELAKLGGSGRVDLERLKKGQGVSSVLGQLQQCVPMVTPLLKDADLGVRRQALRALGKMRDRSAVLPILESIDFDEKSQELLGDMLEALQEIGAHRLVQDLLPRVKEARAQEAVSNK